MTSTKVSPQALPKFDVGMTQGARGGHRPIPEALIEDWLLSAVAHVLNVSRRSIGMMDSFIDLGGNHESAQELQKLSVKSGFVLEVDEILHCETLAELQTCVAPVRPSSPHRPRDSDEQSSEPSDVFTDAGIRNSSEEELHSQPSNLQKRLSEESTERETLEQHILSTPQVSGVALVKPKAGFLENKLIAFVSLNTSPTSQYSLSNIHVVSQSQMHFAGSQVAAIRLALESSDHQLTMPNNWIVLDQIPLNPDGGLDRRMLQTWVQNMNEDMYKQVTSLESDELFQDPLTDMETAIQKAVGRVLRLPEQRVGMNFSFAQLGGDEVSTMLLVATCRTQGITLKAEDVMQCNSLAKVASVASYKEDSFGNLWSEESSEGFKLSPMQQLYFDTATGGRIEERRKRDGGYRLNQSLLLRVTAKVTLEDVHAAFETVVAHHSMLRARFRPDGDAWNQRILPDVSTAYSFGHRTDVDFDDIASDVEQVQRLIDIEDGPVFAVEYLCNRDGEKMILMVAHQLVIDRLSWRILIHDLDELLRQGTLFSERSMPFQTWNELQEQEIERTSNPSPLPFEVTSADFAYWGLEESLNTYGESADAEFIISLDLTAILHTTCNQVFRTDSADIYLAALYLSFAQTFPERFPPTIWNQEHGREPWSPDIDVTETVGWLTSLCPIGLRTTHGDKDDFLQVLRDVKDTRRSTPNRGWNYFASRYFGPYADTRCAEGWPFEILFSYLGCSRQLERENGALQQAHIPDKTIGSRTSDCGVEVSRMALFEVKVSVEGDCSIVTVTYNRRSNHQQRISGWIQTYENLLYQAIGKLRYHAQELTLTDIPLLNTSYDGLSKLNTDRLLALGLSSSRDIEDVYPVTATQQEVLISQTQNLDVCHTTCIYELSALNGGQADQAQICSVWEQIVAKYPALRTVFIDSITDDGLFDQVVLRRCSPNMLFFDTSDDPITALKTLPPMASTPAQPRHRLCVSNSATGTFLKLEASQAICDMPSLQVLMNDLKRIYNSGKPPMKALEPSHASCVKYLQASRQADSIDFWRSRLQQVPLCEFPRLRSTSGTQLHESSYDLDTSAAEIDSFCRSHAVSRDAVMRLAWAMVIRAFTDRNRVCFGYRTPGRNGPDAPKGLEHSVGCFENTVPCPMDLFSYQAIESLVRSAEDDYNSTLPYQRTSLSEIENALEIQGERLFNTCLIYVEDPPVLKSRFCSTRPQMQLSCVESYSALDCDISFLAMFVNGRLSVGVSHRILTDKQAWSVTTAFSQALRSILQSPLSAVGGVDLSVEHNTALIGSSRVDLVEPCVHSLFNDRARACPDAPAVSSKDGDFSYRTLSHLVQRLASYLTQCGVKPGVAVALVLGKTRWSIVSILAVLKAGGCFVPIDGEDPSMIDHVIRLINPRVTLVTDNVEPDLNLHTEGVIHINETLFSSNLPVGSPTRKASGDDVACILFPAGSSRAKDIRGFMYSHAAFSSAFLAQGGPLHINQGSRVFQISSFSVDTALVETLCTLVHGGCVCIPNYHERKRDIDGAIRRMAVNWIYMTPILARRLDPYSLPSLQVTCFRTRALDEDTCVPWMKNTKVLLAYGCLEICPLGISALEVTREKDISHIAKPFLGKFWIANPEDASKLVPNGAVGELCIESPTIAHQFVPGEPLKPLNQSIDQTAEDGRPMVRYIKTSQRTRYVEDDRMELLPNPLQDMTINGKVVSSSKVEQHIRRCLGQDLDVAVETVTAADDTELLAAFLQLDMMWTGPEELDQLSPETKERVFLAKKLTVSSLRNTLPPNLVPSIFIPVRRLPITTALKVNRRKLQKLVRHMTPQELLAISDAPGSSRESKDQLKPLPLTNVEERMRGIWARLLKIDETSLDGNQTFTGLGGGNFLAGQLVVECRRHGIYIQVHDVLRGASLTELCQGITLGSDALKNAEPTETKENKETPIQHNIVVEEELIQDVIAPQLGVDRNVIKDVTEASAAQIRSLEVGMLRERGDVSYLTFNFTNLDSVKRLEEACYGLSKIHPILRTVFVCHECKIYQVAVKATMPKFTKTQCPSWRVSSVAEKLIKEDQTEPLALGKPVTKFFYVDSGKQSALVMRLSKAQYDHLSVPILVQDMKRFYAARKGPPQRPTYYELTREVQMLHAEGAIEYWRSLLDGAEMTEVIKWKKPSTPSASVKTINQQVSVTSLSSLGITFDSVVKAAWAIVLANLSGSGDVLFGEVVEGRRLQLVGGTSASGVFGPAQNTIPVRVKFGNEYDTPMSLLQSVHAQKTQSVPYENVSWSDILRSCMSAPSWTKLSTAVHHQSGSTQQPSSFKLESVSCRLSIHEDPARDLHDLLVTSNILQSDKADIALTFCERRIPALFAEETLKSLCSTIELLTSVSMMHPLIPSAQEYANAQRQIPLPQPDIDIASPRAVQFGNSLPSGHHYSLQSVIAAAWTEVLKPQSHGVPESRLHEEAFFDIWGSLVPSAQLATYLSKELSQSGIPGLEGVDLTMEDIITNPTMTSQFDLIARKMRDRETNAAKAVPPKKRSSMSAAFSPLSSGSLTSGTIGRSFNRLKSNVRGHGKGSVSPTTANNTGSHLSAKFQFARPQPTSPRDGPQSPGFATKTPPKPDSELDGSGVSPSSFKGMVEMDGNEVDQEQLGVIDEEHGSGGETEEVTLIIEEEGHGRHDHSHGGNMEGNGSDKNSANHSNRSSSINIRLEDEITNLIQQGSWLGIARNSGEMSQHSENDDDMVSPLSPLAIQGKNEGRSRIGSSGAIGTMDIGLGIDSARCSPEIMPLESPSSLDDEFDDWEDEHRLTIQGHEPHRGNMRKASKILGEGIVSPMSVSGSRF